MNPNWEYTRLVTIHLLYGVLPIYNQIDNNYVFVIVLIECYNIGNTITLVYMQVEQHHHRRYIHSQFSNDESPVHDFFKWNDVKNRTILSRWSNFNSSWRPSWGVFPHDTPHLGPSKVMDVALHCRNEVNFFVHRVLPPLPETRVIWHG